VADLLANQIRHDILFAILPVGLSLSTSFLEKQYGGSPAYLSEALDKLTQQGFIKLNENRIHQVIKAKSNSSDYITQERISLECTALETSIKNGNIHWYAMIVSAHKSWLDSCEQSQQDPLNSALDFEENIKLFHQKLLSACGSAVLIAQQEKLFQQGRPLRITILQSPETNLADYMQRAKALVTHILAKDVRQAKIALEKLINFT